MVLKKICLPYCFILLTCRLIAQQVLDVETYVEQVTNNNDDYIAAEEMQKNYFIQSQEGSLLFTPRFISSISAELKQDPQFIPYFPIFFKGINLINEEYKVGFEQQTPIGLNWELSSVASLFEVTLNSSKSSFLGLIDSLPAPHTLFNIAPFHPLQTWSVVQGLTVKQHLWKNGFGAKTRAKAKHAKHGALAQGYLEKFKLQRAKIQAASVYWQLVIARALKEIRMESLDQAEKLMAYMEMKKKESLILESEVYQARSILNSSLLEVQKADEVVSGASLSFNSLRGVSSPQVKEVLHPLTSSIIETLVPQHRGQRNDLKAHYEMLKNQEAQNEMAIQDILPEFDVFGSLGLQGTSRQFNDSLDMSVNKPSINAAILVKLSIPLAPTKISSIKRAYESSSRSARLNYERQSFEHNQEWSRLKTRLDENLRLLKFLVENSIVQKDKFENAQSEYSRGLTTFFTVTSAQSDYQSSKIVILQTFQTLIEIILNLSLYEPD